jgi:hypothetical protein
MKHVAMGWHTGARSMRAVLVPPALALCSTFLTSPARADCAAPAPSVVWSYPANGDTGVPTNVDLWLMDSGWGVLPRVSLEGVALTPLELPFGYDLGELAPNTSYTLSIEPDPTDAANPARPIAVELTFTTGSGPIPGDPAAAPMPVTTARTSGDTLSGLCQAVLDTQDCFDTGQSTYFHFAPSGDATAWLITSGSIFRGATLWPAECGDPLIYLHDQAAPCATLHGIDAAGTTHAGDEVCVAAAPPNAPAPTNPSMTTNATDPSATQQSSSNDAGCSLPASGGCPRASWVVLVGLVGLVRRRLHGQG